MKKTLALIVALCLAMTSFVFAGAEQTGPELPAVGEVVYGFEVKEIRDFALIDAEIVRFEHQKTGAQLYYVANDDTNRVFDLTFFTDAIDKTGLPHVFEHSTLDGSEKYPSKALFFNLSYQTYNTYMNAFTMDRMTSYPVASLSEAQLLKYADYYTDSCLHPMIMEDEGIFREEAWRYRLADAEAPLAIEGTVYSEMLGATTRARAAMDNALATAFPGSTIGNNYGGVPDYIPDMTWDMLKDYHNRYYHPSNCAAFLYGSFEDYTAFVKLLDEAFSPFEKQAFTHSDEGYTPLAESVEVQFPFPVEAGSNAEHAATVYYIIPCPGADEEQELLLNTLTDLLVADASPLSQKLRDALPYGSFSCYVNTGTPDFTVEFVIDNVNAEDAALFRDTVNEALKDAADNGFTAELTDACMASLNLSTRLIREKSDVGVDSIIPSLAYECAVNGEPWGHIAYVEALDHMGEWNEQGLYAKTVSDWLTNDPVYALVTTYAEPGLKEANDAALAERLAEVKAAMTEEEINAIVEASNGFEAEDDASEYIAQLQAVTVASLPEEVPEYDVYDETDEAGIRHIDVVAGVEGIGMANVFLDAAGIPQEDLHWFKLYTDLMGKLDTSAHTRAELAELMTRYLYGGEIRLSLLGKGDDFHPCLRLLWTATDADLAAGYDLMGELLFDSRLDDAARVKDIVSALMNSLKSTITNAPYNVELHRALGASAGLYRYYAYLNYIEYYQFLEEVSAALETAPETVSAKLGSIRNYFNNNTNAVTLFAGNEESIELNRGLADEFLAGLAQKPVEAVAYDLPTVTASEALVIDSAVQFNGVVADYASLGLEGYEGGLDALTALVSDTFLYPMLRDQYGAYSVLHGALSDAGVYIISYRDPNVAETFDVYAQLNELVSGMEVDQETLDGYILSSYAGYAMPAGELSGALSAGLTVLDPLSDNDTLECMQALKAMTPEKVKEYAGMYEKLMENGIVFTAGAASVITANAERYETVLNPFNAADPTQVAFSDVPEDHEQYEAVRFVFENGLMVPAAEDAFGAEEAATAGDLYAALYVLVGGDMNPEDAVAFFAQYGLAPADADLAAEITDTDAVDTMSALAQLMGGEWTMDAADAPATRGDLAAIVYQFYNDLGA